MSGRREIEGGVIVEGDARHGGADDRRFRERRQRTRRPDGYAYLPTQSGPRRRSIRRRRRKRIRRFVDRLAAMTPKRPQK